MKTKKREATSSALFRCNKLDGAPRKRPRAAQRCIGHHHRRSSAGQRDERATVMESAGFSQATSHPRQVSTLPQQNMSAARPNFPTARSSDQIIREYGYHKRCFRQGSHRAPIRTSMRKNQWDRCRRTVGGNSAMLAAARTTEERHGIRARRGGSIKQRSRSLRDSHRSHGRST